MRITWRAVGLALSAFCATPVSAHADDFRVFYAEQVALKTSDATEFVADLPTHLSFIAYGRQFELDLEPNSRLLSKLPADIRASLSHYQPLRGRLTGLPGSWVRLTRNGSEWHGAIWDGLDLYIIAPARTIARALVNPLGAPTSAPVVFRFSDAVSGLGPRFCGTSYTSDADDNSSALTDYNALVAELRANAALLAVPQRQIEVATIGDFEFFTKYQSENPQGVLITTMNMVDGIFSEQVGVAILLPVVSVFNSTNDPFTTNIAQNLLDELGAYREATPEVRSRGLAHLITGRNLTGDTAGIAYLDALCEPFRGVSLTDDSFGNANTFLIAAHELGHNFGAPHDAEAGSPCAAVPPNFIMAPEVNGSDTFSQCSLEQMAPRIAAAACITRSNIGDAAIAIDPATIRGFTGDTVLFGVDISSIGTAPVRDVVVNIPDTIAILSATVSAGTCSIGNGGATCQLGTIDDGASRRVEVGVRSFDAVTTDIRASLTASNDRDTSNNNAQAPVIIDPAADMSISLSPTSISTLTGQTFALTATLPSAGPRAANDVSATVRLTGVGLSLVSATSDSGTCTTDFTSVTCSFGSVAPGATRRIDVQGRGTRADNFTVQSSVSSSNDGNRNNNFALASITMAASRDVTVQTSTPNIVVAIGQAFSFSATVRSAGPETVHGVTSFISVPSQIVIDAVSAEGGTCTVQPALACTLGDLPSGTSRRIDLQAHGTQLVGSSGGFSVQASDDEDFRNNSAQMQFTVKHASDIAMNGFESRGGGEGRIFIINTPVMSRGLGPASDVVVNATMPASFTIHEASLANGNCTITLNRATCMLNSLAGGSDAMLRLDVSGALIGSFSGTITASASNDAEPANNALNVSLQIIPFVDVGLILPTQPLAASVGELFTFPISVVTGPQPVANVVVRLSLQNVGRYTIESMSASFGSCTEFVALVECALGTLPDRTTATVNIGLRASTIGTDRMVASVNASNDMDSQNNNGSLDVVIANRGNAVVRVTSSSLIATVNQPFAYPTIVISADRTVDAVFVDISLPPATLIEDITSDGPCGAFADTMTCDLGTIAGGTSKQISPRLRVSQNGTFSSVITLRSLLDTDARDNTRTVSLTVNDTPQPPPSDGDGGGGGGGALGLISLVALLVPAAIRRERSRALRVH